MYKEYIYIYIWVKFRALVVGIWQEIVCFSALVCLLLINQVHQLLILSAGLVCRVLVDAGQDAVVGDNKNKLLIHLFLSVCENEGERTSS